jgi:Ca2+-binding EF-hand superfamily protein
MSRKSRKITVALLTAGLAAFTVTLVWAAHSVLEFPISVAALEARDNETFARVDSDSSGEISREELADAQPVRSRPRHDVRGARHHFAGGWRGQHAGGLAANEAEIFAILDSDGDGQLSADEFSMAKQHAARETNLMSKRFDRLDTDGSGTLGMSEFPAQRMQNLDVDGDGEITREEMRNGMRKRHTDSR